MLANTHAESPSSSYSSSSSKKSPLWIAILLLGIAILPRAVGLWFNKEANDDHIEVVELWIQFGQYPDVIDCWECFQPPLYSTLQFVVAKIAGVSNRSDLIYVAHSINFVLSLVILWFLWRLIDGTTLSVAWKSLLFLFFALNPKLVAINIQATNDTLLIAIGLAIIAVTRQYVLHRNGRYLAILWCLAILAPLTKGNGLIFTVGGCAVVLFLEIFDSRSTRSLMRVKWILFVSLPLIVFLAGPYVRQLQMRGSPFAINQPLAIPAPFFWFDQYFEKRLGVRTIVDCFGTFRYVDLLAHPYITNGGPPIPIHRTSFWTLLYGQAFHSQYEQYPHSWVNTSPKVQTTARLLYVLGLVPLSIGLWGIFGEIKRVVRHLRFSPPTELVGGSINLFYVFAFVSFLVVYTIDYRDFANTKLIFAFPVYTAFTAIFIGVIERMQNTNLRRFCFIVLALICALYLLNLGWLMETLIAGGLPS